MRTRGAHSPRAEHGDRLAALDEERLVLPQPEQRPDDLAQRVVTPRGTTRAAVDDELLRVLGDLGVEVVEEHSQRRLGLPGACVQRRPARRADRAQVAAERLDADRASASREHADLRLGRCDDHAGLDGLRDALDVRAERPVLRSAAARARARRRAPRAHPRRARAARGTRSPVPRRAVRSRARARRCRGRAVPSALRRSPSRRGPPGRRSSGSSRRSPDARAPCSPRRVRLRRTAES